MMSDLFKQSSVFSGIDKSDLGQLASSLQCDNTFKAQMVTKSKLWKHGYEYINFKSSPPCCVTLPSPLSVPTGCRIWTTWI